MIRNPKLSGKKIKDVHPPTFPADPESPWIGKAVIYSIQKSSDKQLEASCKHFKSELDRAKADRNQWGIDWWGDHYAIAMIERAKRRRAAARKAKAKANPWGAQPTGYVRAKIRAHTAKKNGW